MDRKKRACYLLFWPIIGTRREGRSHSSSVLHLGFVYPQNFRTCSKCRQYSRGQYSNWTIFQGTIFEFTKEFPVNLPRDFFVIYQVVRVLLTQKVPLPSVQSSYKLSLGVFQRLYMILYTKKVSSNLGTGAHLRRSQEVPNLRHRWPNEDQLKAPFIMNHPLVIFIASKTQYRYANSIGSVTI